MKVVDNTGLSSLIIAFEDEEARTMAIVEVIKINEFTKQQSRVCDGSDFVLYSLNYRLHKHRDGWFVSYEYVTDPSETTYNPPVYDIAIRVPVYTRTFVSYRCYEDKLCSPPDNERHIIIKPKKNKRQNGSGEEEFKNLTAQSIYTAYSER